MSGIEHILADGHRYSVAMSGQGGGVEYITDAPPPHGFALAAAAAQAAEDARGGSVNKRTVYSVAYSGVTKIALMNHTPIGKLPKGAEAAGTGRHRGMDLGEDKA